MSRAAAAAVAVIAAVAACQGRKQEAGRVEGGGSAAGAARADAAADPAGSGAGGAAGSDGAEGAEGAAGASAGSAKAAQPDDADAAPDPSKQIADLGAIPAWRAVVDRAALLARRGAKGVVYGRVGPAVALPELAGFGSGAAGSGAGAAGAGAAGSGAAGSGSAAPAAPAAPSPYVWLVDDTEGNGALGVRLALGKLAAQEGDRVAASGAWALDDERRWFWKAEALQPLSPPPAPPASAHALTEPPLPAPSHAPAPGPLPSGARPIRQAKDYDAVYFQLSGPIPAREGDGWLIAGQHGEPPAALLILPGERPSYGGQDLRSPDERWQLKRHTTYWVRVGKVRPQGAGQPVLVNARTAPIRVQ